MATGSSRNGAPRRQRLPAKHDSAADRRTGQGHTAREGAQTAAGTNGRHQASRNIRGVKKRAPAAFRGGCPRIRWRGEGAGRSRPPVNPSHFQVSTGLLQAPAPLPATGVMSRLTGPEGGRALHNIRCATGPPTVCVAGACGRAVPGSDTSRPRHLLTWKGVRINPRFVGRGPGESASSGVDGCVRRPAVRHFADLPAVGGSALSEIRGDSPARLRRRASAL